jgi:prepilin-type N-terminal cleavage/methylation domain-containing protein
MRRPAGSHRGFTLIELIVVMTIVALLLALVTPRYLHSLYRSKETVLHANLDQTRDAIDKYYGDTGAYPDSLGTLVERRYLRKAPYDPLTDSTETWVLVPADGGGVSDLHSGAEGNASDGTPYAQW